MPGDEVKPAPFTYERVDTALEAVERLRELGPDAKVLAGGQSLVPMMNFRLARPPALVDITRAHELRGVRRSGPQLRIGALTTHAEVEHAGAELDGGYEVLRRAAKWVGHAPIRARGTFGGSLAHADPAAEWCMLAVALDATLEVVRSSGTREVPVGEFLLGYFTTALEPDEVLGAVRFPAPCRRAAIEEFARRHGDFALVAVAVTLPDDGPPRVVIGGVDAVPVRARDAERIVAESQADPECFADAGRAAAAEIEPGSDVHAGAEYRRELTAVLVHRALARAVGDGG
jgi:carbon-monoxide dehydrogenase medium subunit